MSETKVHKIAKLDLLEKKISAAVRRMGELNHKYLALLSQHEQLEGKVEELKVQNSELAGQLKSMEGARQNGTLEEKKILSKIDRMIEKFEELQI